MAVTAVECGVVPFVCMFAAGAVAAPAWVGAVAISVPEPRLPQPETLALTVICGQVDAVARVGAATLAAGPWWMG